MKTNRLPGEAIPRADPLRETVYRRIADAIAGGHFAPGAPITESSIVEAFGVSRTPIREALLRLEAEGVLESRLARGFVVRSLSIAEAEQIYPIHAALEALALKSIQTLADEDIFYLSETSRRLETCDDAVDRWRLDSAWHDRLIAASGNQRLAEMLAQSRMSISRYELSYMQEIRQREKPDEQHRDILAAIGADGPAAAADLLERHWIDGMQTVIAWLRVT